MVVLFQQNKNIFETILEHSYVIVIISKFIQYKLIDDNLRNHLY